MPIVTKVGDTRQSQANTSGSYSAPRKTLQANTRDVKDIVRTPGAVHQKMLEEVNPEARPQIQANTAPDVGEETTQEPTATPEAQEKPAVTLSPQLTALARKEQAFRKQEQAFKLQQQEFEAKRTEFDKTKAEYEQYGQLKTRLSSKDYAVLDELGVSYEDWTNYLLSKGEDASKTPAEAQVIQELKSELKTVKDRQEEVERKAKESVDKQYEATVNQYRKEIDKIVSSDPNFDSIKSLDAKEHVLQHILQTFEEDGEVLTVEDAAKEVEEFLVEDALKLAKLKKVQEKLKPVEQPKEKKLPPPQIKTITNQIAPASTKSYPQFQHLSPADRLKQALAKAQRQG